MRPGDGCGAVRRAVVDDEDRCLGKGGVELVEDGGEVALLVPGGDEDDGAGLGHRAEVRG